MLPIYLPLPPVRYSRSWAASVVNLAFNSYPRAWEIVRGFFGLSKTDVVTLLACGSPMYPKIRTFVHLYAKMEVCYPEHSSIRPSTTQMLSSCLARSPDSYPFDVFNYLTAKLARLTIKSS